MNLSTLIGLILLMTLLIMGWVAWRRIRQEPRRLANAGWIAVTLLLGIQVLAILGFSAPLVGLGFLLIMSPRRCQVVEAMGGCPRRSRSKDSRGVRKPSVARGRSLSSSAIAVR